MLFRFLVLTLLGSFVLVGCVQNPASSVEQGLVDEPIVDQVTEPVEDQTAEQETEKLSDISFVGYTNKALGYTIQRPDKWYWRHYTRLEIGDAAPNVDDYFITDINPVLDISSAYPGRIVIEVSSVSLETLAAKVSGFAKTEVKIAGQQAFRYEGVSDGVKIIEYHFTENDKTYRIYYNKKDSGQVDEAIFEHLSTTISFGN
jgi:hypothetical protein